jgi:hypothetical protein
LADPTRLGFLGDPTQYDAFHSWLSAQVEAAPLDPMLFLLGGQTSSGTSSGAVWLARPPPAAARLTPQPPWLRWKPYMRNWNAQPRQATTLEPHTWGSSGQLIMELSPC